MRAAWLGALLLAGCSAIKTYPSDPSGNLQARAMLDAGVKAMLHIHRVDARCATEYAGSVGLGAEPVVLAVPDPSYVVVSFDTSSFLGGSRSTIRAAAGRDVPRRDLAACRG